MKKRILFLVGINLILILLCAIFLILSLVTNNSSFFYLTGVFSGIVFATMLVSLLYLIIWKKRGIEVHFDERQLKNRGTCFSTSFFVLIACLLVDGICRLYFGLEWSSYFVGTFTWIIVSIGVFAILAIWKDAYTSAEGDRIKFAIFMLVIGLFDFTIGLAIGILDGFITNKQLDVPFVNLFSGIVLLVISINLFVKVKIEGRERFEDEELKTEVC